MSMVMRTRTRASSLDSGTRQPLPTEPNRFHLVRQPETAADPNDHPGFATPGNVMVNPDVSSVSQARNRPENADDSIQEVEAMLHPTSSANTPMANHTPSAYVPPIVPESSPSRFTSPVQTPSHALARSLAWMSLNSPSIGRLIDRNGDATEPLSLDSQRRVQRGRPQRLPMQASPTPNQRYLPAQPSPLGPNYTQG
ncbi:hypothetical protein PQX77_002967 [Marasmius sp. AFHP31]|nr:hypothetical protein PQX77_002967 [Marasmius sp. AFHP31]